MADHMPYAERRYVCFNVLERMAGGYGNTGASCGISMLGRKYVSWRQVIGIAVRVAIHMDYMRRRGNNVVSPYVEMAVKVQIRMPLSQVNRS